LSGFPGGGFGSGGGGGGGFGGGGFHAGGFDAFNMFEQMFNQQGGGGRRRGGPGGGGFQFNFGGGPGMGGGRRAQPQELFPKGSPVIRLGKPKFPDNSSKYIWLVVFCGNEVPSCQKVKPEVEKLAEKVKDSFKVGAVDCTSKEREAEFCMDMGVDLESLPAFAMVIDGKLEFYFDDDEDNPSLPNAKGLHTFAIEHMPKALVANINHMKNIEERLLSKGDFVGSVLLLTDKYETSSLYYSLAYHYRKTFNFGESRAKNLNLAKEFGVKKYPLLIVLVPKGKGEESYSATHDLVKYSGDMKADPIIKWLDQVEEKIKGKQKSKPTQNPTAQKKRNRQRTEF